MLLQEELGKLSHSGINEIGKNISGKLAERKKLWMNGSLWCDVAKALKSSQPVKERWSFTRRVGGAGERGPPNEMRTTKKVLNVTFVILFAFWQIITALNTNSLFRSLREQVFEDGNYHGWFFLSIVSKKNLVNIECPTQSEEHWQRRYDAKVWIAPRCNVLAWLLLAHKAHKGCKSMMEKYKKVSKIDYRCF